MKLILGVLATTGLAGRCPSGYSRDGNQCCYDWFPVFGGKTQACWMGTRDYEHCYHSRSGCDQICVERSYRDHDCSCHSGRGESSYWLDGQNCRCHSGYSEQRGGDNGCFNIDECSNRSHNCHTYGDCKDTPGTWQCSCDEQVKGYEGNGQTCTDIDECSRGRHNCHSYATCANKNNHSHHKKFECTCKTGYNGNGYSGTTYHGPYSSANGINSHGNGCWNKNECTEGGHNCHADAVCTDKTPHNDNNVRFTCKCKDGFVDNGYGTHCTNINECTTETDKCDPVATCTDSHGDHGCKCPIGYTDSAEGTDDQGIKCDDIDECANNPCHADAVCTNTIGSYHCDCNEGYQGEGHNDEENKCSQCHEMSSWVEKSEGEAATAMTAVCTCNEGWEAKEGTKEGDNCIDSNECEDGSHLCDPNATCTNTIGSHYCTCNVGYFGFGQTCTACDPETSLDEMVFECAADKISVTIPYCAFYNVDITNHGFLGTGENCTMENTGINVEMSIPTTSECGTEVSNNGTYLMYTNAVIGDVREHDGVVTRKKFIDLDFECAFEADFDISSNNMVHAMIDHVDIQLERQDKEFDIQMGVFTDDTFTELVDSDYSIVVPDIIHAAVQLMDGEDALVLLAEKCWATPSSDPEDATQYVFLDNFCSTIDADNIFNIGRNGVDREAQFELESFEFDGYLDGIIYLHCHANVCDTELEDCDVDCTAAGRRRRSTPRSMGATSAPLRVGPIRVIDPKH